MRIFLSTFRPPPIYALAFIAIIGFLARIVLELPALPIPLALAIVVAVLCVGIGLWLSGRARLTLAYWWPVLLLLVYCAWPARDLRVAACVLGLAAFTFAISNLQPPTSIFHLPPSKIIGYALFILSLITYTLTLQPDVLPADSGEFQIVASQLGVAHPPGFPLYTLVGKLFTLLTPWRPALGLNLMSALLAALTLKLVFDSTRHIIAQTCPANEKAGLWGGLAAALALGTCTTFWAQATTANIRMPTLFFMAWCLYEISNFQTPASKLQLSPPLTRFALALSLGIGHHPSLIFVGAFFVVYLILLDPPLLWTPRRWPRPVAAFALGQLVWLYLPIRGAMGALFAPDDLHTLQGLLFHVLAQGFAGDMFAFASPRYLPARAALVPTLFLFQFHSGLLVASLWGALVALWRNWRMALLLLGGWALHVFITITYRAPQTVEYMMPAYILLVVALGLGVGQLVAWSHSKLAWRCQPVLASAAAAILLAGLLNGANHAPGYLQLAADRSTREYVTPILQNAPAGAIILADWHWATPLQYLQIVEGARPDVQVEYVYPVGDMEYALHWLQLIDRNISQRPVVVTRYAGREYSATDYDFYPLGQAFLALKRPTTNLPPAFTPVHLNFEDQITLAGYQLERAALQPGETVELSLAWQPSGPLEQAYSFTAQVLDAQGQVVAKRDLALPAGPYTPGELRAIQFVLPLAPDLLPGNYRLVIGAYFPLPQGGWHNLKSAPDGATLAPIAEISLAPAPDPPLTLHPLDLPFENGWRLEGIDYDQSDPATLRVYLHWAAKGSSTAPIIHLQSGDAIDERPLPAISPGARQTTLHDLAAGGPAPTLALYNENGQPIKFATAWGVAQTQLGLPFPAPGSRYVLLGNQLALINVSLAQSRLQPGGELQLELGFAARRSLVSDNSMSVRLVHRDSAWWLPQDTKPALDTIRTLKWIAGSQVVDPHTFALPADAAPGWAEAHLTVYDEFRQAILPPLDGRMGDSVLLGSWEIKP